MFKKILSSIGIGSAKVDTIIPHNQVMPGDTISGYVTLTGGSVTQHINGIQIQLYTTYETDETEQGVTEDILTIYDVEEATSISAGEERKIHFSLEIPPHTPISFEEQKIYLKTLVSVSSAIDPQDFDLIEVLPNPIMKQVLKEIEFLGFAHSHKSGICKEDTEGLNDYAHFIQEFEFKPMKEEFRHKLDEVEVVFVGDDDGVDVYLQVDKKTMLELNDESFVHIRINNEEGIAEGEIASIIREFANKR